MYGKSSLVKNEKRSLWKMKIYYIKSSFITFWTFPIFCKASALALDQGPPLITLENGHNFKIYRNTMQFKMLGLGNA